MKDSTRAILQLITADGYNPPSEDPGADPQKQMLNGVKLWEQVSDCAQAVSVMQDTKLSTFLLQYCKTAPTDSNFQARFKLIPQLNMDGLGEMYIAHLKLDFMAVLLLIFYLTLYTRPSHSGCPSYISKYNGKPGKSS